MITRADMKDVLNAVFNECRELMGHGQKEYAHDEANAMANFERTGEELGIPRDKVLMIFARKHWDGIVSYVNGHKSQRESVKGRINDCINYLVLLRGMIEDNGE